MFLIVIETGAEKMKRVSYLSMALIFAGTTLMAQPGHAASKKKCSQISEQSQCLAKKNCKWVGKAHVNKCQKR